MIKLYEHTLERVFCGFIRRDPGVLAAIAVFEGGVDIREDALEFTLPGLHEFSCQSYVASTGRTVETDRVAYLKFRKTLYRNPTNHWLSSRGGRVDVGIPNPDHDLAIYRLIRVATPDPSDQTAAAS